jgi:hypothetical protein
MTKATHQVVAPFLISSRGLICRRLRLIAKGFGAFIGIVLLATMAPGQLIDNTLSPNAVNGGVAKSLIDQAGKGRGHRMMPESSMFIIQRDPFRSIRRGRQLFQRKFTRVAGQGPLLADGAGNVEKDLIIGAGLADSCAACHGRPRGAAGFGGDVATRPDSRDAPHLFGLGLKEMLADEMTAELRKIAAEASAEAEQTGQYVVRELVTKGVEFGTLGAYPRGGGFNTNGVAGVNTDLRVRPFFAHGDTISIREFIVGAFNAEMGLQAADEDLFTAAQGGKVVTPAGMVLDGSLDKIEAPPVKASFFNSNDPDGDRVENEMPQSIVDHLEFYLLNYFKPGLYEQTPKTAMGRQLLDTVGCTSCHIADLQINEDRRVADVETVYDPENGHFNSLFATAIPLYTERRDRGGFPSLKTPKKQPFVVKNIFTDIKRHDLGVNFYEREYDGTYRKEFLTTPLWGVGSTAPYGHDGRSINLSEVILRHGGEAQASRDGFAALGDSEKDAVLAFLSSLVIFPPDDTASNLDPGDSSNADYPQKAHGSIKLGALFNDPSDVE